MQPERAVADLESFLAERGEPLLRTAVLLAGNKEAGEDLLQAALERLLKHWRSVQGSPEGYLRRTLYNLAADGWRRESVWRRQLRLLRHGTDVVAADPAVTVDLRDALVRLLMQLPPRQRAVIVARYWEELSEAETAAVLGCSVGTVKSQTWRALRRLRELIEPGLGSRSEPAGKKNTS
jgi:RNA polymerase sigma-70 factor (sigma-E family)